MKINATAFLALILMVSMGLSSCQKKEGCTDPLADNYDPDAETDDGSCTYDNNYQVPETYNFEHVDYSGQTARLDMMEEMSAYMKSANKQGNKLDAQKLLEMFANEGGHFTVQSSKDIKSKTYEFYRDDLEGYMNRLAVISQSSTAGSNGTAGIVVNKGGTKQYLFDTNGFEYTQLIEKGIMGATFYYQATAVYLAQDKIGPAVDNELVTPGKGTDMEHHWDEAFGYFGVPKDFPGNRNGIRFWGKYSNTVDPYLGSNAVLMDAFLKGRAAISNKDMDGKDKAIQTIREEWERVVAATAIHYLNGGRADLSDDALRNHQLSEAIAFIRALKYNPIRKISDAEINSILDTIGGNLYEITAQNINTARDQLSTIYGLDHIKHDL